MFAYVPSFLLQYVDFWEINWKFPPVGVPLPRVVLGLKWQVALVWGVQMQVQAQGTPPFRFPLSPLL